MPGRRAALTALVAGATVAVAAGAAPARIAAQRITAEGVGKVKLGSTYTELRKDHLIGKIRPGCELGGPNTRSARLQAPLEGGVDFTVTSPRKVSNISISAGATARGVGIGDRIADIRRAYPRAKVDHTTDRTFELTLVRVPKGGGGRLEFAVDVKTKRITVIGVPYIAFCE